MEMRQIQFFLTVARSLNFTQAAAELQVSQATLSRQISAMESELNLLLFLRDNRNVRLTECGEYLNQELSKLYGNYSNIVTNAKRIFEGYSGQLTFGVLDETSLCGRMQDNLYQFQKKHPEVTLNLKRHSFKGLTDGLLDMSMDFAVTLLFDVSKLISLRYKKIANSRDGILISAKSPLSKKKLFTPKDFRNETFIVISDEDSRFVPDRVVNLCAQYGFYPKLRVAPDLNTAMLWTEAGMGFAFSHQDALSVRNPSLQFIPFEETVQTTETMVVLVWNPMNGNPAIASFLKEYQ